MTHNNARTYPRLATPIAFVGPDDLVRMVEAVIRLQRDHGDRTNRRRARLKYVVDDMGVPWVRETLAAYYGGRVRRRAADAAGRAGPARLARAGRWPIVARRAGGRRPHRRWWHDRGCAPPCASGAERFAPGIVMTPQQDVLLTDIAPATAPRSTRCWRDMAWCRPKHVADGAVRPVLPRSADLRPGA